MAEKPGIRYLQVTQSPSEGQKCHSPPLLSQGRMTFSPLEGTKCHSLIPNSAGRREGRAGRISDYRFPYWAGKGLRDQVGTAQRGATIRRNHDGSQSNSFSIKSTLDTTVGNRCARLGNVYQDSRVIGSLCNTRSINVAIGNGGRSVEHIYKASNAYGQRYRSRVGTLGKT